MKLHLVIALFLASALSVGIAQTKQPGQGSQTQQKTSTAGHQAHMQALLDKVNSTWKDVQTATNQQTKDAALKAHGEALAELNAAHQKMAASGGHDMMEMCQEMMAKHKTDAEGHDHNK